MQLEKERIERERIEGVLARLMRGIGEVDLRRMWGGGGNQDADAEVSLESRRNELRPSISTRKEPKLTELKPL